MNKPRPIPVSSPEKSAPRQPAPPEPSTATAEHDPLSPERIEAGVTTTTAVLAAILHQKNQPHAYRDWGINE